jgi:hypothetical protein
MAHSSNHLPNYRYEDRPFKVEIIRTPMNTTAYHVKETQGAEYGAEAEKIRMLFESAPALLEALEELTAICEADDQYPIHTEKATQAINKAKGV